MAIRKRKTDSNTEVEVQKTEGDVDLQGNETQAEAEERQKVEELKAEPSKEELAPYLSPATRAGITDDVGREEFRKAYELTNEEKLAEAEAKEEENREVNSTADEEQYTTRLKELENASTDMRLSYNERFEARQKADVLRAVINDMKGEGDPAGETLATSERKTPERIGTIVSSEPTTRG